MARRTLELIRSKDLGPTRLIANRVESDEDRALVEKTVGAAVDAVVPDDPALRRADARGRSAFDEARQSAPRDASRMPSPVKALLTAFGLGLPPTATR